MPQYDESFLEVPDLKARSYHVHQRDVTAPPAGQTLTCRSYLPLNGQQDGPECPSSPPPLKGGHAPRGGKLARRARSFKDDFLEILAQMRSPSNPRSQSPHSPKSRASLGGGGGGGAGGEENERSNPLRELDILVRQVQFALKHFRDVVSKNKLEMLPGNGTVVLDTITNIVVLLRNCLIDEQSSTLLSATSQLHQCVARLIRLCDDVVLYGSQALGRENVNQLVQAVQDAVQNLVSLARDKLSHKHNNNHNSSHPPHPPSLHLESGRASLPDIPLTPRERQILQQTSTPLPPSPAPSLNHSLSSESILQASPPPKPPLPTRLNDSLSAPEHPPHQRPLAPPLPPKRRHRATTAPNSSSNASLSPPNTPAPPGLGNDLGASSERLSVSPAHSAGGTGEDSSSLLSASKSGSLDSVLNQSRRDEDFEDDSLLCLRTNGNISPCFWGSSSRRESIDSPIFLSPHELLSLQEPPPASLLPSGGTTRTLLNCGEDVADFRHASLRTSSSSYMSQQSSMSYSSESSSFTSRSFSSSKRTLSTEQSAAFSSLAANLSMLSNGNSPPALPQKMRSRPPRHPSQYDNVSGGLSGADNEPLGSSARMHNLMAARETAANLMSDLMSASMDSEPLGSSAHMMMACGPHHTSSCTSPSDGMPPPLPLKKKHIMAYMEMFGNCSSSAWSDSLMLRHSVHAYSAMQAEWARSQAEVSLSSTHSCLFASTSHSSRTVTHWPPLERVDPQTNLTASSPVSPPALPPKLSRTRSSVSPPPPLPPIYVAFTPPALPLPPPSPVTPTPPPPLPQPLSPGIPQQPIYDFGRELPPPPRAPAPITPSTPHAITPLEPPSSRLSGVPSVAGSAVADGEDAESSPLEEMDVTQHLVFKKPEEEGPDIRGGHPDALIVQATKANKNEENEADFLYQEAFLTTYRTFLSPLELTRKLQRRYERFAHPVTDHTRQRAARNAFSLLVRVVSDLTMSDLEDELLRVLMDLIFHLLCCGDLNLARALRVKVLEKCEAKRTHLSNHSALLTSLSIHTRQSSLLDFKSEQVAEQMTLLDAELFMKIEIPEVLIWAQEQNEERSPNLTRFTEHFNKMSYWARSRILEQRDAKDRERYVVKFIKVMRHLRRANNFNSYLALLSALDSAPIRRLEWHRQITEGLKEYCALIDSSSSFRAYRQALAETQPPCIPYIGLVLQDLTFVHIGNSDLLPDGNINFSKRWQQFNIVENMKRFKKCQYAFKKQERILALFSNFDDCLCEEAMWQISETIKPRGGNANKK